MSVWSLKIADENHRFSVLIIANVVSVIGGSLSFIALPWFVYATTSSPILTATVSVAETVPTILMSLLAGRLIHIVGPAAVRIFSDLGSAGATALIPLLYFTVGVSYWHILLAAALNGLLRAPAPPASLVMLEGISKDVEADQQRRRRSIYSGVTVACFALGVPVGGLIVGVFGAPMALAIDAFSTVMSALLMFLLFDLRRISEKSGSAAVRLSTGVHEVSRHPTLLVACSVVGVCSIFFGAWNSVLAPAYGQQIVGSAGLLGIIMASFTCGAIVGNSLHSWIATRISFYRLIVLSLCLQTCLSYTALWLSFPIPLLVCFRFFAGVGMGIFVPLWIGEVSRRTGTKEQGYVFGVFSATDQSASILGALSAALLLSVMGLQSVFAVASIAGCVVTSAAAIILERRKLLL